MCYTFKIMSVSTYVVLMEKSRYSSHRVHLTGTAKKKNKVARTARRVLLFLCHYNIMTADVRALPMRNLKPVNPSVCM